MTTGEELPKAYEPTEVESRWYPEWMAKGIFTADPASTRPSYCIVLPPPNVTGSLHLGHALTATIQDILIRWKRMSGFNCLWLPGMDHAGIATQTVVEKELKKSEGKTRHDLGREVFLGRVWAWKEKYGARIGEQHKVLGASLDWTRERFTMDAGLSQSVREVFVRLYEEGLVYRAYRLITWCPNCITALSDLEVDHTAEKGSMWHIAYPVDGTDVKLVVATTRPETMLGDTAVALHPNDPRYMGLHGASVRLPLVDRKIPIVLDAELVDMNFGTGVVKVTPGHDQNDYQTGLRHKLEQISIFDEQAKVNDKGGSYQGLDRTEARKKVLEDLEALGLLVKEEPHELNIGRCQRCHTVVEPMLSMQWFVKTRGLADTAMRAVDDGRTRFVPETWTNTFRHWMTNIQDWCVSRQLWWGHQIPAWYPKDSPRRADGSIDVAKATPTVAREKPEGEWEQDPDVLDTWFSSALWPFSTLGWPEQTPELKAFYPNSVMETGHDIIFFWVARMMMMGLHFMGDVPFRTVFLHAMVRDEKGDKMSKTKGNVIDPLDLIRGAEAANLPGSIRNRFPDGLPPMGADALRFTLASLTQQGRDIKLSVDRIAGYKAFCNKLWNASRFAMMNLEDYRDEPGLFVKERALSLADRWILARLNRAIAGTNEALVGFHFSDAASTIYQFLWGEFCDWYIELAKGTLTGDDASARASTQAVLVFCLDHILRLLHPFMPFITEEIWQKLPITRPTETICLAPFPVADRRLDDTAAEAEMKPIVEAIEGIRTIRGESNLNPGLKLDGHIHSTSQVVRESLERHRGYLMPLAGLSRLTVSVPGVKPPQAAADIRAEMEIYVPLAGIVDLAEERERLKKEIIRTEQELMSLKKKLDNPNFVQRAPAEVVEKDRARQAELTARMAKMADNLKRIEPAEVRIAPPSAGTVNLGEELKEELSGLKVPETDSQVREALDKLREGTREGLTSRDRYDLGVAYMNMGLVDDAVREFNMAKEGDEEGVEEARAAAGDAKPTAKKPAAKKPASKKPAAKKPAAKKPAAKKPAAKKAAAKKAAAKKPAAKKPPPKKGGPRKRS